MAKRTYVITNRKDSFGTDPEPRGELHYLVAPGAYTTVQAEFRETDRDQFKDQLLSELEGIKKNGMAKAAVYIHGYNNDFKDAIEELSEIGTNLQEHADYDGLVIGFTWPSEGQTFAYIEDRDDARESVTGFVNLMHLIKELRMPAEECWIDLSMLVHSMGNYVLREGLHYFTKHLGYPWDDIYFHQTIMFAADIGYDSLEIGKSGQAIANFSHRVTTYHSTHDDVLGLSRGAKHFGSRRLGRSGPKDYGRLPDNVVAVDCSQVLTEDVHGSYRNRPKILEDFVATMAGQDRAVIPGRAEIPGSGRKGFKIKGEEEGVSLGGEETDLGETG